MPRSSNGRATVLHTVDGGSIPPRGTILTRIRLAAMPPGLGPGFRRFESYMRDHF